MSRYHVFFFYGGGEEGGSVRRGKRKLTVFGKVILDTSILGKIWDIKELESTSILNPAETHENIRSEWQQSVIQRRKEPIILKS